MAEIIDYMTRDGYGDCRFWKLHMIHRIDYYSHGFSEKIVTSLAPERYLEIYTYLSRLDDGS